MRLDHTPTHEEMQGILARLNADPGIEYAEADGYRYVQAFPADPPNDPHFLASTDPSNASNPTEQRQLAWPVVPAAELIDRALGAFGHHGVDRRRLGAASIVVAVIDTGIIDRSPGPDRQAAAGLRFRQLRSGQFHQRDRRQDDRRLQRRRFGRDLSVRQRRPGLARRAPPIRATGSTPPMPQRPLFVSAGCTTVVPSSWHGTKVAGVIGAWPTTASVSPALHP